MNFESKISFKSSFKSRYRDIKNTIKINIKLHKKFLIITIIIFISILAFFLYTPIYLMLLILGIAILFLAYDYISFNKGKKRSKTTLILLFLLALVYIGGFIFSFPEAKEDHAVMGEYEKGIFFTEDAYFDEDGKIWYFDTEFKNRQGEEDPEGSIRFPVSESLSHYVKHRDDTGCKYNIHFHTNLKMKGDIVTISIYGSDTNTEKDKTDEPLFEENMIVEDSEMFSFDWDEDLVEQIEEAWDSSPEILKYTAELKDIKGDYDYGYLFFVLKGEFDGVAKNLLNETDKSKSILVINELLEEDADNKWSYSEKVNESAYGIVQMMLGDFYLIIIITTSIVIIFMMTFLVMFVSGTLKYMKEFLIFLTMIGVLVLFTLIMMVEQFELIQIIWGFIDMIPNINNIADVLAMVFTIISIVVATMIWLFTVGTSLAICWMIYWVMGRILDYARDIFETNILAIKSKIERKVGI